MLTITIPEAELWDESKQEFIYSNTRKLQLEHSLVSISKWESKWHKSFLDSKEKTNEEILDYIKCMTINKDVDETVYYCLSADNLERIKNYIDDAHTATTFHTSDSNPKSKKEIITSELIYYWMIVFQIPVEFQKWHLNRLLTLIKLCEIKSSPGKKMSQREILSQNAALNAARRKKFNTKG